MIVIFFVLVLFMLYFCTLFRCFFSFFDPKKAVKLF